MNTKKIYVAGLNIVFNAKMVGYGDIIFGYQKEKYVLVKKSLFSKSYIDIETNEKYRSEPHLHIIGEVFIDKGSIKPLSDVTDNVQKNISKNEAIEQFKQYKKQLKKNI